MSVGYRRSSMLPAVSRTCPMTRRCGHWRSARNSTRSSSEPTPGALQRYADAMEIEVVVEVPKGSRNKYEIDPRTGVIRLDRQLFTATRYPADYGFVLGTLGEDGDPLDALILLDEPTFPGIHVAARAVGVLQTHDEAGGDPKLPPVAPPDPPPPWPSTCDLPRSP